MSSTLVILAGGHGSRMAAVTSGSKAALSVRGEKIAWRLARQLSRYAPDVVLVVNERHKPELAPMAVTSGWSIISNGTTSDAERRGAVADAQLGLSAREADVTLLAACDNVFEDSDVERFAGEAERFLSMGFTAVVASKLVSDDEFSRFGILTLTSDGVTVTNFEEKPVHSSSRIAALGLYALSREAVSVIAGMSATPSDNMGLMMRELVTRSRVAAINIAGPWHDVGTPESLMMAGRTS